MNYEMIVTFTQTDVNAYDFPVGERKIDASPWIKQGYRKLTSYQIYNPNAKPLVADSYLFDSIKYQIKNYKDIYPKLYRKFNQEGALEIFLNNKELKSQYLYSYFNNDTNQPTDDYFLVTLDGYQIEVQREFYIYEGHHGYLFWSSEVKKIPKSNK